MWDELQFLSRVARATSRRTFLQWSGMTIAVTVAACDDDDEGGDVTAPTGEADPAQSTAEVPATAPPTEPLNITVQARDSAGNPVTVGGEEVTVNVTGANTEGPLEAIDNGDGTYETSYTPLAEGQDSIAVTMNDVAISGSPFTVTIAPTETTIPLGRGDTGLFNYVYALEQLSAAFYSAVLGAPYAGITPEETQIFTEIRDHEVIHRELIKSAVGPGAIPELTIDFASVDLTSRDAVLAAAQSLEDLGVSALNGAAYLLDDVEFLDAVGKLVSVEARHAAVIRDLVAPLTPAFAGDDVVDANGQDAYRTVSQVLQEVSTYVPTALDASQLPRT